MMLRSSRMVLMLAGVVASTRARVLPAGMASSFS